MEVRLRFHRAVQYQPEDGAQVSLPMYLSIREMFHFGESNLGKVLYPVLSPVPFLACLLERIRSTPSASRLGETLLPAHSSDYQTEHSQEVVDQQG